MSSLARHFSGRAWPLSFLAFFLLGTAWALAAPYNATPDEFLHVIRAAGVVQGQVFTHPAMINIGETGAYQTVPAGLVPLPSRDINPWYNWCYHGDPTRSAACGPQPGRGGAAPRTVFTSAGRYNPVYYAVVGEPLVRWPNWTGIILARLISVGLCAAFLTSAWLSCVRSRRGALMGGALLVAVTPMALEMAGGINPNSVEIAAGACIAAAAIPLMLEADPPDSRALLRRAAVGAIAIAQFRATGPVFIACWLAVLLIPPVRARLRQLWRSRSTWLWSAGILISCVVGAAWTVVFKAADLGNYATGHLTPSHALAIELSSRLSGYLGQMVDGFGYYDTEPPEIIFLVWAMALGLLLLSALTLGNQIDRWRLGMLVIGTLFIPIAGDVATVNKFGFTAQGRYILPLAVGIPLLAAFIISRSGAIPVSYQSIMTRLIVVLLLPFHFFSLVWVMDRWQWGVGHSLNPLYGLWHPVTGSALPLLTMALGLVLLGVFGWRAASVECPFSAPGAAHEHCMDPVRGSR